METAKSIHCVLRHRAVVWFSTPAPHSGDVLTSPANYTYRHLHTSDIGFSTYFGPHKNGFSYDQN